MVHDASIEANVSETNAAKGRRWRPTLGRPTLGVARPDKLANRLVYDTCRPDERLRFAIEPTKVHASELIVPWVLGQLPPGGRLIDIGGGAGSYASQIVRAAPVEVVGVDISQTMIDQRAEDPLLTENIVGDMEALPLPDGSFDVAVFVAALHHVPDPLPALREALRVLRPGGTLLAFEPSSLRAKRTEPVAGALHEFRTSGRWLADRAGAAGFRDLDLEYRRLSVRVVRLVRRAPSLRTLHACDAVDRVLRRLPALERRGEVVLLRATKRPG